jgi:hypothetical protein
MPNVAVRELTRPHRAAFPVALYLVFAAADLVFSLFAFSHGVAEGNPAMAWLLGHGLFIPGKILLSLAVAALMMVVYTASRRWWWAVWGAVTLMGVVVVYHVWALPQLGGA